MNLNQNLAHSNGNADAKRKAPDKSEDVEMSAENGNENGDGNGTGPPPKAQKTAVTSDGDSSGEGNADSVTANQLSKNDGADERMRIARAATAFIPFLAPEDLLPPKMPTREEMESVLLALRKKALVEEYFGE